jgi:hypothetical protein
VHDAGLAGAAAIDPGALGEHVAGAGAEQRQALGDAPTIGHHGLAGDEGCVVGAQERGERRDVFGLTVLGPGLRRQYRLDLLGSAPVLSKTVCSQC